MRSRMHAIERGAQGLEATRVRIGRGQGKQHLLQTLIPGGKPFSYLRALRV